jgi:hypothetical protein
VLPKSLSLYTTVVNNGIDIVNVFAKYFSNSYSNVQQPPNSSLLIINKINLNSDINLNSISCTELDVFNLIFNIKLNSNVGPDGIHSIFLYSCRFISTPVLTNIFKLSLKKSFFPLI